MDGTNPANQTAVHPLGLALLLVLGVAVLLLPRRYAVVPLLVMACFMPPGQRIVILGLDWTFLRLLVLVGVAKMLASGDLQRVRWQPLDLCVAALAGVTMIAATLRTGSFAKFVTFGGVAFDEVGMYVLFRAWITSWRDVQFVIRSLIVISVPVSLAFINEFTTHRNVFHAFGGVPELTPVRAGRVRCTGAFAHAILAGCFWASMLPLFAAQAWSGARGWLWAGVGTILALLLVVLTASSTPLGGVAAGLLAAGFFLIRQHMRLVRWGVLGALILLQIVMKAPVWHLISRVDLAGGSTGYHRYRLINSAIGRLGEWILLGTDSTAHWGHAMFDVTNEFLVRGFRGGIVALALFVAILCFAYQGVGRIWHREQRTRSRLIASWALGAALFAHTMMFLAVSYFGQILIIWSLLLAMIGSLASRQRSPRRVRRTRPADAPAPGLAGAARGAATSAG